MRKHRFAFSVAVTTISRVAYWRDRLLRRVAPIVSVNRAQAQTARYWIPSGRNVLDSVLVTPANGLADRAVLLCHGIGETVEHWYGVQLLLAAHGTASLVFDYSGYGRSSGAVGPAQCERDAIAAYEYLQTKAPERPIALLGFSLGSGIATAILDRITPDRLLLCAAFTSFQAAARSMGIPALLSPLVPPIWRTAESLPGCSVPVSIVHGEKDRMFPLSMAHELAAAGGANSELVVVPNLGHNQPFYRPDLAYWGLILERICAGSSLDGHVAASQLLPTI